MAIPGSDMQSSEDAAVVGALGDRVDSTAVRLLTWNLNARLQLEDQLGQRLWPIRLTLSRFKN